MPKPKIPYVKVTISSTDPSGETYTLILDVPRREGYFEKIAVVAAEGSGMLNELGSVPGYCIDIGEHDVEPAGE